MRLWPPVSGNTINGVGEARRRRPSPIYWHAPDATPHGPLQRWFYGRTTSSDPSLADARHERQKALDLPMAPIAEVRVKRTAEARTTELRRVALAEGADDVGVTAMRAAYVFDGCEMPPYGWMLLLLVGQDYEAMASAPSPRALVEVTRQYGRGIRVAKAVANALRREGHDAQAYGGPMAGSFVLIPAAIEAGLGELGKHGSMIHRRLGSNFRIACVLTNAPLSPDGPHTFGADDFCARCRVCTDACPPRAIVPDKQLVRGERRWYVDFDRCLPYFNEHEGCAICLAVCPFSRPGVGERLVAKLARRRSGDP